MLVHDGKYGTENSFKNRHTTKTKHNTEKANNTKYSKTKLPGSVTSYDTRPGNEVGLLYNGPKPTRDDVKMT